MRRELQPARPAKAAEINGLLRMAARFAQLASHLRQTVAKETTSLWNHLSSCERGQLRFLVGGCAGCFPLDDAERRSPRKHKISKTTDWKRVPYETDAKA
jgi:hypothetical protein